MNTPNGTQEAENIADFLTQSKHVGDASQAANALNGIQ